MRVLVLGGTRFIGPFVLRALAARGAEMAVFHRGKSEAELPAGVETILGDRAQIEEHEAAFRSFGPDVVLDMRPLGEDDSERAMRLFTGMAQRAVMVSSIDVYRNYDVLRGREDGPPDAAPLREDSPLRSILYPYQTPDDADPASIGNVYDKILAEGAYLSEPELPGTVLRLPFVYGPNDYQHRLHTYLKRMDDKRPAILFSQEAAGWRAARCYVENVAHAIALAVTDDRAAYRVYNVAEPEGYTEHKWAEQIARVAQWPGQIVLAPDAVLPPALRCDSSVHAHLTVSSARIREELGYVEVVGQDDALARTIEWERAYPPAQDPSAAFDYAAEDAALAALNA